MKISVDGNMNAIIDGSNYGKIELLVKNKPELTGELMEAIRAFYYELTATTNKEFESLRAEHSEILAKVSAENGAKIQSLSEQVNKLEAQITAYKKTPFRGFRG